MSRACRDLDSPIEDFCIVTGAILLIVAIVFGVRFLIVKATSDNNGNKVSLPISGTSNDSIPNQNDQMNSGGEGISAPDGIAYYSVFDVRDGDTIEIATSEGEQAVRLIGIDTPETVHPEKPVECYGPEASDYTKANLLGKTVGIEYDDSQGLYDDYGRLLAYVYVDGYNFNLNLIRKGYAYEYTYAAAYKYQSAFQQAESDARDELRGLWGVCSDLNITLNNL